MLPLVQFAADEKQHHIRDAVEALASYFGLTELERAEMIPSGKKFKFDDRVQWANTYLKKAGLLESVSRGTFRITSRGQGILRSNPSHIDTEFLMQFPEFVKFKLRATQDLSQGETSVSEHEAQQTPQEVLQSSYQALKEQLAQDLLDTILSCPPNFFERLVMDLLLALGYGGAIEDAGEVIGRTGDSGIDGVIKEDKLGFDAIYIQAKRWDQGSTVSRPTIQAFAGSLIGQGALKGVFITTSSFSKEAINYTNKIAQPKIILIDGQQLAKLMIDNNIGVTPVDTYIVKKVDFDYFQLE
nr:Restriction endonuclease [uncultured bacterium]